MCYLAEVYTCIYTCYPSSSLSLPVILHFLAPFFPSHFPSLSFPLPSLSFPPLSLPLSPPLSPLPSFSLPPSLPPSPLLFLPLPPSLPPPLSLGIAVDMSEDHKPTDQAELCRIERAGGCVGADGRVNGGLNLSRAIG